MPILTVSSYAVQLILYFLSLSLPHTNTHAQSGHFPFTLVQLMDSAEYDADIAELERKFNSDIDRGLA